jgi:hypothetical protein
MLYTACPITRLLVVWPRRGFELPAWARDQGKNSGLSGRSPLVYLRAVEVESPRSRLHFDLELAPNIGYRTTTQVWGNV